MNVPVVLMLGLFVLAGTGACVASKPADPPLAATALHLSIQDDPAQRRFTLVLTSNVSQPICIEAGAWPNAKGQIGYGGQRVRLIWDSGQLPAREGMQDYCPGGCAKRIPANTSLEATLGYEEFGDPERIAALPGKRVELKIEPVPCPDRR